jgi:hypothetical protein
VKYLPLILLLSFLYCTNSNIVQTPTAPYSFSTDLKAGDTLVYHGRSRESMMSCNNMDETLKVSIDEVVRDSNNWLICASCIYKVSGLYLCRPIDSTIVVFDSCTVKDGTILKNIYFNGWAQLPFSLFSDDPQDALSNDSVSQADTVYSVSGDNLTCRQTTTTSSSSSQSVDHVTVLYANSLNIYVYYENWYGSQWGNAVDTYQLILLKHANLGT